MAAYSSSSSLIGSLGFPHKSQFMTFIAAAVAGFVGRGGGLLGLFGISGIGGPFFERGRTSGEFVGFNFEVRGEGAPALVTELNEDPLTESFGVDAPGELMVI
tara:strand:+ start:970 stop:1278 length:309 start_codon:yes stop_codon:yes gene_type:complete